MTIHTIGESHSVNGWQNIEGIKIHYIRGKLAYSIGRDGIDVSFAKAGDTLVFCFGEIDCRCHVHKHITKTRSYKAVIDAIVERYTAQIKKAVGDLDVKVCLFNVLPPVQKANTRENPNYPYLGTDDERKLYARHFNNRLQEFCQENQYVFFDVYDKYADSNGFLNKALSDGNVHVRDEIHIVEFLNQMTGLKARHVARINFSIVFYVVLAFLVLICLYRFRVTVRYSRRNLKGARLSIHL